MNSEVYDYPQRIARYKRHIANLRNGELAIKLLDHLTCLGLSQAALSNYASHLIAILRLINFDAAKATRTDIERIVAAINSNNSWKESTKHHKKVVLRKLIQYAKYGTCEKGTQLPTEVSWLKLKRNDKDSSVTPEALITKNEFEALVKAADNPRDRAMLYVLFEGALRPGELLSMSIKSVDYKNDYCLITVNGKTGLKRLPLIIAYKPLLEWLRNHPNASDPNAPLWCSLAPNRKGQRLCYRHFRLIIKRIARQSGLKKPIWPYIFRHSTLTAMAKVLTEPRLELFAGWTHGSRMTRRYVHFSARDLEDAILGLYGLRPKDNTEVILQPIKCERCGELNPPGSLRCCRCGFVLDKMLAQKLEEETRKELETLKKQIAELKAMVNSAFVTQTSQQSSRAPQVSAKDPREIS
ncbi:MAG: tyrosine-type recombinase/integrase [Candidatus Bathyarchaeia archaeon]